MSFREPKDLFSSVQKMLLKAPFGTEVSAGIKFRPEPKGFDGREKLVCHFMIDATVEKNKLEMEDEETDLTEDSWMRKYSQVKSTEVIDDRSTCSSMSCGLTTSAIFPDAFHISPRSSASRSDSSLYRKSTKKPVTPNYNQDLLKKVPHILETKLSSEQLASNLKELKKYLKASRTSQKFASRESSPTYASLGRTESVEVAVDLTTEQFETSECEGV